MQIDHVLIAAPDLAAAAREMEKRHGLASIAGGRHPGWGTANRIVPLRDTYLELVAVVDEAEARQSVFGQWVNRAAAEPGQPFGWAVRTRNVEDVAHRLGLTLQSGSRRMSSGARLEWRTAGLDQAASSPCLPFFIEWAPGIQLPGQTAFNHPGGCATIARLLLRGDAHRLADWLNVSSLPIVVRPGIPAVTGVVLSRAGGDLVVLGRDPA